MGEQYKGFQMDRKLGGAAGVDYFFSIYHTQLAGGFKVFGPENSQDFYGSELSRMLAILCVVHAATQIFQLAKALVTVACDGESGLVRVFYSIRLSSI
jgi:hypothetical protein